MKESNKYQQQYIDVICIKKVIEKKYVNIKIIIKWGKNQTQIVKQ